MRWMTRGATAPADPTRRGRGARVGVLLGLAAALGGLPAAQAADSVVLVSQRDPKGDVRYFNDVEGLGDKMRISIDLRRADVSAVGDDRFRFRVKIRQVVSEDKDWDQMFFFLLRDGDGNFTEVGFTQKNNNLGYAYTYDEGAEQSCRLRRVQRMPAKDMLAVVVPETCVMAGPARVRVFSYAGHFRTDAHPYSMDRARFERRLRY